MAFEINCDSQQQILRRDPESKEALKEEDVKSGVVSESLKENGNLFSFEIELVRKIAVLTGKGEDARSTLQAFGTAFTLKREGDGVEVASLDSQETREEFGKDLDTACDFFKAHYSKTPEVIQREFASCEDPMQRVVELDAVYRFPETKPQYLLHQAIQGGYECLVEDLIRSGYNLEEKNEKGLTPLQYAAMHGESRCVEVLLAANADKEATTNKEGYTPFHLAVMYGHLEIVKLLVKNGVNHEVRDSFGSSAIHHVFMYPPGVSLQGANREELLKFLLALSNDVNIQDGFGRSALHLAAMNGEENLAVLLLDAGATRDGVDMQGRTPFSEAVYYGRINLVQLFIKAGASPQGIEGDPLIHLAAFKGHLQIVRLLKECGAHGDVRDRWGKTALDYALLYGKQEVAALLRA
ncbi:MAG: ankyrin repeat domain-containing protein [Chlamydiia bacterium]|nr:ankyrin repeat domain-containing protein [Chlamydiia bacterium]